MRPALATTLAAALLWTGCGTEDRPAGPDAPAAQPSPFATVAGDAAPVAARPEHRYRTAHVRRPTALRAAPGGPLRRLNPVRPGGCGSSS